MKIAITGASGLIGRAVTDALQQRGVTVVSVGRRQSAGSMTTAPVEDYSDVAALAQAFSGCRDVLHLAANPNRRAYDDALVAETAQAMTGVAQAAAIAGVRRMIIGSSTYATFHEEGRHSTYGLSKIRVEEAAKTEAAAAILLRFPPVYGRGSAGFIDRLARLINRGIPLPLGLATTPRQILSLDNLADAIGHLCDHPAIDSGTFTVADPDTISLREIARHIAETLGTKARLLPVPLIDGLIAGARLPREPTAALPSWTPPYSSRDGLLRSFSAVTTASP